jgi:hypothetical protein
MNHTADKRRPWRLILRVVFGLIAWALIRRFLFWTTVCRCRAARCNLNHLPHLVGGTALSVA